MHRVAQLMRAGWAPSCRSSTRRGHGPDGLLVARRPSRRGRASPRADLGRRHGSLPLKARCGVPGQADGRRTELAPAEVVGARARDGAPPEPAPATRCGRRAPLRARACWPRTWTRSSPWSSRWWPPPRPPRARSPRKADPKAAAEPRLLALVAAQADQASDPDDPDYQQKLVKETARLAAADLGFAQERRCWPSRPPSSSRGRWPSTTRRPATGPGGLPRPRDLRPAQAVGHPSAAPPTARPTTPSPPWGSPTWPPTPAPRAFLAGHVRPAG